MKKTYFVISLILFSGACSDTESSEFMDSLPVNIRIDDDRVWRQTDWIQYDLDYSDTSVDILNPVLLTNYKDKIYLGDWGDMSVKVFTKTGDLLQTVGSRGRGPGEFQRIMDMAFFQDYIFISDPEKHEIILYSTDGELINSFSLDYSSFRLAASENNLYTLALQDSLFTIYNHEGDHKGEFGRILDDPIMNQLSLTGRIDFIDQLDLFLYIPRFASYLYYYTSSGRLYKTVQTLDGIPFAEAKHSHMANNQVRVESPDSDVEIMDYWINDSRLYLLGRLMTGGAPWEHEYFIDIYHITGDQYEYSYKLPVPATQFTVIGENYYFIDLTDQSLVSYKKEMK